MSQRFARALPFLLFLGILTAIGCGGAARSPASQSPPPAAAVGSVSTGGGGSGGGEAVGPRAAISPGASASADYGGEGAAMEASPAPESRPGLGTEFGEQVQSHVNRTAFHRGSTTPFATVAMYYNNAEGVAAQAASRGGMNAIRAGTPSGGIQVWVVDMSNTVLPGFAADGRTYVVGSDGQRYRLIVQNNTGGRYEVVASVDGLDVVDGRPASPNKRGYILHPNAQLVIDGFRTSDDAVAAFRFGAVAESYAARTSGDRNVGVIGFAFFAERGSQWTSDEIQRRETANPFPGYAQPPPN